MLWQVTDDKRLAGCHRWRSGTAEPALVWHGPGVVTTKGLQDSHSAWASPVSSAGIAKRRMSEMEAATRNHFNGGGGAVLMAALTMSHTIEHGLAELLDVLTTSFAVAFNANKAWLKRYKCQMWARFTEVTHGRNGWHPHIHALIWVDRPLEADALADLEAAVLAAWVKAVAAAARKAGVDMAAPSLEHGVKIDQFTGLEAAVVGARYVAKGNETWTETWTPGAEAAGGAFKAAKNGNVTPWQILDEIKTAKGAKRRRLVALWREYEAATKGRRQMSWSRAARERLGVEVAADEEIDAAEELAGAEEAEEGHTPHAVGAFTAWPAIADDVDRRREIERYVAQALTPAEAERRARVICETMRVPLRPMCVPIAELEGALNRSSAWDNPVLKDHARAVLA